jgi:hypothetical protein
MNGSQSARILPKSGIPPKGQTMYKLPNGMKLTETEYKIYMIQQKNK